MQFNPFTAATNTNTNIAAAASAAEVLHQTRPYSYCKKILIFCKVKEICL